MLLVFYKNYKSQLIQCVRFRYICCIRLRICHLFEYVFDCRNWSRIQIPCSFFWPRSAIAGLSLSLWEGHFCRPRNKDPGDDPGMLYFASKPGDEKISEHTFGRLVLETRQVWCTIGFNWACLSHQVQHRPIRACIKKIHTIFALLHRSTLDIFAKIDKRFAKKTTCCQHEPKLIDSCKCKMISAFFWQKKFPQDVKLAVLKSTVWHV